MGMVKLLLVIMVEGIVGLCMRVGFSMAVIMELAKWHGQMAIFMKDNGKGIKWMEQVHSDIVLNSAWKEYSKPTITLTRISSETQECLRKNTKSSKSNENKYWNKNKSNRK